MWMERKGRGGIDLQQLAFMGVFALSTLNFPTSKTVFLYINIFLLI
jgi:hypothetical protein